MSLFDRVRDTFKHNHETHDDEQLRGYRRLGEQVYEVEVELAESKSPRAHAILEAAKCFQMMADALLYENGTPLQLGHLPNASRERAEQWYGRIPDLLVAARQEVAYPNSSQVGLPVRFRDEPDVALDVWSNEHLFGLRRAVHALEDVLDKRMEHPEFHQEKYKDAILHYQDARTRRGAGDLIVGQLLQGQTVSDGSRRQAQSQYISTLASYLLIAQGLEEPVILTYEQIDVDFGKSSSRQTYAAVSENSGGPETMNFEQMQQQSNNIQQHNSTIVNQLQQIVGKVQQLEASEQNKQEISFALRELALSVRGLNQETMGLLQNMALYIQHLENSHQHAEQYQQKYPPQYQQQPQPTGGLFGGGRRGGFWDTLIQSAEIGAGFEIGSDIVDNIFGGW